MPSHRHKQNGHAASIRTETVVPGLVDVYERQSTLTSHLHARLECRTLFSLFFQGMSVLRLAASKDDCHPAEQKTFSRLGATTRHTHLLSCLLQVFSCHFYPILYTRVGHMTNRYISPTTHPTASDTPAQRKHCDGGVHDARGWGGITSR